MNWTCLIWWSSFIYTYGEFYWDSRDCTEKYGVYWLTAATEKVTGKKKKTHCAEGGKYFIALLAKSSKEPEKSNQRGKGTFFPSTQPDFFSTQPNSWFHSVKLHQNNKRWPLTVNATIGWYLINKEPHSF